jgi:hypothetical protein
MENRSFGHFGLGLLLREAELGNYAQLSRLA